MECNKEEAIRAKSIAESKMLNKDFIGAKKIVLKAQQLYPDLEHVSQMLTVCEVHISAESKVNEEINCYGILQVQSNADELTIRKQYRKLALLLHPDKNNFGGAEAAFKLVGEAHRTLSDKSKRALYDMKRGGCRTVSKRQPAPHTNKTSSSRKQPGAASCVTNSASTRSNGSNHQPGSVSTDQTFWTLCPSCGVRYQYYQSVMNKALRCQSCKNPFIAYDMNAHPMPSAAPWNRSGVPQQEKQASTTHFDVGSQGNTGGGSAASQPCSRSEFNTEFCRAANNNSNENFKVEMDSRTANDGKFEKVKLQEANKREQTVKPSVASRSQKRGRKTTVESGESGKDNGVAVEGGYHSGKTTGSGGSCPRRSSRHKQNTSCNEDANDDFVTPRHKKSKTENVEKSISGQTSDAAENLPNGLHKNDEGKNGNEEGLNAGAFPKASANVDFGGEALPDDPEEYNYPDPEFYDFQEERDENKFAVDQIWALYDHCDAMPRYYALIRHVYGPKFKLRFSWLEYDPASKAETLWYEGGLPIGCGTFKLGKAEVTQERLMFSHLMPWRKGTKKNTYDIFPKKGEVWALFKNWDIEWSSSIDADRHYEYEIVEVMSDFTEGDAISVIRLVKVQGFVSVFVQAMDNGSSQLNIQMKDILRFSHNIPSYRLKGDEREGIPKGSLELDCASIPLDFTDMFPSSSVESVVARAGDLKNVSNGFPTCATNKSGPEPNHAESKQTACKEETCMKEDVQDPNPSTTVKNDTVSEQESATWYEIPDSEFHDFEDERLVDKFEAGQIWALYSNMDKNPNYYGRINKVESESFKAHLTWLEGYSDQEHEKPWFKLQLPIGCGTFKTTRESVILDTVDTFSHLVRANPTTKKNRYAIYPHVGEIWAVYKNWSISWSYSDLQNCDFDLVEILDVDSSGFKVLVLSKVKGYRAVYKAENGVPSRTMNIPIGERLKLSHKIPCFRLTEERGGKLRGYYELDPAGVPDLLLVDDSS